MRISEESNKTQSKESDKIQVTFNKVQLKLIDQFKGVLGNTRAEVVRYIVANWLVERSSINKSETKKEDDKK